MQSPIKVWRKDPRYLTDFYQPGMDLGPPDEIIQPESLVKPGDINPPIPRRGRSKKHITRQEYQRLKRQKLSDRSIAAAFDISTMTLTRRKREWEMI